MPAKSFAPATLPPEYIPLKRRLMSAHRDEFAALRQQDLRLRLFEIAVFVLAWVGGITLTLFASTLPAVGLRWPLQALGIFAGGVALFVFFLEAHEGMHNLLFKPKLLNDCAAFLFCLPLFLSYSGATLLHRVHHRYLGSRDDPDEYRFYAKTRLGLWLLYYGRLFVAPLAYVVLIPILGYRYGTTLLRRRILLEIMLMLAIYLLIFTSVPLGVLWLTWLLPSALAGFLIGLWGVAQHAFNDGDDPLLASRSIRAVPLVTFCFINQNYHLEHHLFPEIPSYHLGRACRLIWPQLPYLLVANSYSGFMLEFVRASLKLENRLLGYTKTE